MKKNILILLASLTMTSCYKDNLSAYSPTPSNAGIGNGSGSSTSHYCGYTTKKGTPCKRVVSGNSGYCWQHR